MAFVPNVAVAKVAMDFQQGTRPFTNVLHVGAPANPDESQLLTIATLVYDAFTDAFMPLLAGATVAQSATAYSMASTTAPVATFAPTTPVIGGQGGDPLPLQSAAVLTLRTNARGRSGRGRIYLSGWSEGSSVSSSLTPAASAALTTAAAAFRAALLASSITLVVYSTQSGGVDRTTGVAFPVTSIVLRSAVFGSQRDRNNRESSS